MEYPIKVNYEFTNNKYQANKWLNSLPEMFAADFEVASRYTIKEKELYKFRYEHSSNKEDKRIMRQIINSNGLSHPSFTCITHLSIAWSDRDSKVIVCDRDDIRYLVTRFLVTTDRKQLWHNAGFDFKHIFYLQHKIPSNFEDTQLLAKSLINDANPIKGESGLKPLMAYAYGSWAIAKDSFTLEDMWNPDMIKYAATDSPATYKLYTDIMDDLKE